jgi:Cof subfamily protein (haloacid dehalogenase superfamily)
MPIRLLALDLDGTLLNSRGELSERNFNAIRQARVMGVSVAIVTGRRFRDARPLALQLGLDVPVISHNGALTKHATTLETVKALLMPLEAAREVIEAGMSYGADALVSDDPDGPGLLVYDHINDDNLALVKYIEWSRRTVGDDPAETVRRVPSLREYLDHEPIHIAFSGRCEPMAHLAEGLRRQCGSKIRVLCTIYPKQNFTLVDVLHPNASKGTGVEAAAAELSIAAEEVMAIGDNHNDIEMLHYAGTGVVMANAESRLLDTGEFFQTASNDEDGVALAIERFILEAGG